jgi:hypothetical protein
MKYLELISYLAKKEGLKKQVTIAQIKEVVGELCELLVEEPSIVVELCRVGKRRKYRKK